MENLVSIIIPVYNEKRVKRAIKSCLMQSYKNIEVLVIDDGSEEDIFSLISEIEDKRIVYKRQERNSNANVCRNIGIKTAKGKYVCFLDSDDIFLDSHVESCLNICEEKKCDGLYGSIIVHNGQTPMEVKASYKRENESMINYLLEKGYGACTSTLFMTRDSALAIQWDENLKRHQDYDFVVRYDKKYVLEVKETPSVVYDACKSSDKEVKIDFSSCISFMERNKSDIKIEVYKRYISHMLNLAEFLKAGENILEYYRNELSKLPTEEYDMMNKLKDYNFNYQVEIVN